MADSPEVAERLGELIEGGIVERMFPGAVVYASVGGERVVHAAFGRTTYEEATARPIRRDDLWDLASLTKLYTTAVALRLVERGLLALEEPVRRLVPEVGADWTLTDLVSHRTGTTANLLGHAVARGIEPCVSGQGEALWAAIFGCQAERPLAAGESHYSDVDFLLVQALCERAAGRGLGELLRDEVAEPLGLADTMFCPPDPSRCVPTEVDGRWRHRLVQGEVHDEMSATLGGAAGHAGVFGTAADVGRFCEAWLGMHEGVEGWLSPRLREEAFRPHSDDFGLGWHLCHEGYFAGLARYGAVGHLGFTGTSAFLLPSVRAVAVVLTNRVHPKRDAAPSRLGLIALLAEMVGRMAATRAT